MLQRLLRRLDNMTLRRKVWLNAFVGLAAVVLLWGLVLRVTRSSAEHFNQFSGDLQVADAAAATANAIGSLSEPARAVMSDWKVAEARAALSANMENYRVRFEALTKALENDKDPRIAECREQIEEGAAEVYQSSQAVFALAEQRVESEKGGRSASQVLEQAVKQLSEMNRADAVIAKAVRRMESVLRERTTERLKIDMELSNDSMLVAIAIGITMAAILVLFSWAIAESVRRQVRTLQEAVAALSQGNLDYSVDVTGHDEIAELTRGLVSYFKGIVRQIRESSTQMASAATEIFAAVREQEAASQQQSASVEEVSRTMETLLAAAAHISEASRGVLGNADRTRQTTDTVATKVAELRHHTGRITEILEIIREIADRSDLLALNASIEAVRAGDAGQSFALVAAEIRRLAERVTASVADVKALVADIQSYGMSAALATDEGRKLAESTTESARQINMVTEQQRSGTEQVSESMKDISGLVSQSVASTQQTRGLAEVLKVQADKLKDVVGLFGNQDSKRAA